MKRFLPFFIFLIFIGEAAQARHIAGGEMSYTYLGPLSNGTGGRYLITLHLYRDCFTTGAQLDNPGNLTIFRNDGNSVEFNDTIGLRNIQTIELGSPGPCIDNPPVVCYQIGTYTKVVDLPTMPSGYTITFQRCCRIDDISNVVNSGAIGATYSAVIPGTNVLPNAWQNSSAKFGSQDTVLICENNPFYYDFSATDADGDQLTYEFDIAYSGASSSSPQPVIASPPPYNSVPYAFPFVYSSPMGPDVKLDPNTGWINGIAPVAGIYVITVVAVERRQGVVINRQRKDLHIKVAPCSIAAADLQPEFVTCDGYNLTFQNKSSSSLIKTYFWDFGLPGNADTSNASRPTFTYPDTGQFRVTLITNRNQDCSDTAYTIAKVYPGFFPDFSVLEGCKNVPIQFLDKTTAKYGSVNLWKWTFGNPQINPDTSRLQNPTYVYPNIGSYQVQFIVGSSKGCRDTIDRAVNVLDKPTILLTNDTLICSIDTLQLNAAGIGSFVWSPNYMISNLNIPNPLVSPDVPTKYYVTLTAAPGCVNTDSVFVNVKTFVTLTAGNDTTICLTDTVRLNPTSDALNYRWTPAGTLNNPNIKNPIAKPSGTTLYTVVGNIGKCQASDQVNILTIPYPAVQVSNDTAICFGDQAQLKASGGIDYRWSPAAGLTDNRIPDPIASPKQSTRYIVTVFDNKGCPKPTLDSVIVRVVPPVPAFAGNDTAIVLGQPLQLNASGGTGYQWTPSTGLNNPNIGNPIATLSDDFRYAVRVNTPEGCFAYDTINIRVFKTNPDIFVPTAFTPNHDGLNDNLIPIPVGVSKLDYFRVYNRYGEQVFATSQIGQGWNGMIQGKEQNTGTYAWYVQGTDYTGKIIFKKGTTTLIR